MKRIKTVPIANLETHMEVKLPKHSKILGVNLVFGTPVLNVMFDPDEKEETRFLHAYTSEDHCNVDDFQYLGSCWEENRKKYYHIFETAKAIKIAEVKEVLAESVLKEN